MREIYSNGPFGDSVLGILCIKINTAAVILIENLLILAGFFDEK